MNKSEQLIACLEGEIAKRDARIVELESQYQRDVLGLNNEGDPIGGEPAGGYANDNARLRAELAATKAQGAVILDESQEAAEFESQFQGCKAFMRDSNASEAAGKYVCQRSHMFKVWMHFRAMLAAPAAPAADAGAAYHE